MPNQIHFSKPAEITRFMKVGIQLMVLEILLFLVGNELLPCILPDLPDSSASGMQNVYGTTLHLDILLPPRFS